MLWVSDNCSTAKIAADIVTAVKNAGGLDKVIDLQRLARKEPEGANEEDLDQADAVSTKTPTIRPRLSNRRAALKRAATVASFKMKLDAKSDDLILLVGRYRAGTIEIVKATALSDDKLARRWSIYSTRRRLPTRYSQTNLSHGRGVAAR